MTGTAMLMRLGLRRDRVRLAVWVLGIAGAVTGTASSLQALLDATARADLAAAAETNPALVVFYGRVADTSVGGLTAWRTSVLALLGVAVMSVLTVLRHTRADEEAGRAEMVASGVVGRRAPLMAAVLVALLADLLVGAFIAAGLSAVGLPAIGSLAVGLATATEGAVMTGVAAVTAQLTEASRPAAGLAFAVLAVSFGLRAVGDLGGDPPSGTTWPSWLSSFGWAEQVHAFAGERWWVLSIPVAVTAVLVGAAQVLVARRDLGAGLLPTRPGPARASVRLGGPAGLAWRLQRGLLLGWVAGGLVLGISLGAVARDVGDLVGASPALVEAIERMGGSDTLIDGFLATGMGIAGLLASVYGVQAALRLHTEETDHRAEPVLASAVGRLPWAGGHLAVALGGSALVLGVVGAGAGLVHGLRTGDVGGQFPRLLAAALVEVPAVWVVVGVAVLLFGAVTRASVLAWAAPAVFLLLGQLGPLLRLDAWLLDLSPFTHVPHLPGAPFTAMPLVWLLVVAAVLGAAGLAALRHRDLG